MAPGWSGPSELGDAGKGPVWMAEAGVGVGQREGGEEGLTVPSPFTLRSEFMWVRLWPLVPIGGVSTNAVPWELDDQI